MSKHPYKYLIIFLILILSSCGRSEKSSAVESPEAGSNGNLITVSTSQFEQGGMVLGKIENIEFKEEIFVNGKIDVPPQNKAVVSVPLGGYVTNTSLIIGDKVSRGQLLLTLSNPEFVKLQQEYLETKEQLRYLEAEYRRHQKLFEEKITSEKNYLRSESDYKTAVARNTGLKRQLYLLNISPEQVEAGNIRTETSIHAPIDGSISQMNITKGAFISPATEIFEIINTEHIHLELAVFEKDILAIKEGQAIEFSIPEASDQVHRAKVYRIGSSIDENRRVVVHGHIEESTEFNFLSGMFVNATIIIRSKPQRALPESALVEIDERNYVLKLTNRSEDTYSFQAIEVEVLDKQDGIVALYNETNFSESDQFLTRGAFSVMGGY